MQEALQCFTIILNLKIVSENRNYLILGTPVPLYGLETDNCLGNGSQCWIRKAVRRVSIWEIWNLSNNYNCLGTGWLLQWLSPHISQARSDLGDLEFVQQPFQNYYNCFPILNPHCSHGRSDVGDLKCV